MTAIASPPSAVGSLVDQFQHGLDAPICLTWELTYACNLACVHCLSSSGRRDPRELSTEQCKAVIDELERMQVFYVNIGGGEPTVRSDFWELVDYATAHHVGVKFSTNGSRITAGGRAASWRPATTSTCRSRSTAPPPRSTTPVRGEGTFATAMQAMQHLADAGFTGFKISVVMTRENVGQLDAFKAIADRFDAQLRITRLRPSGRAVDVWDELHPTAEQQRELYEWLLANGERRPHRRLVLPPRRLRREPPGPQPVRRRPRGVPDRPGGRRLRLPVRHPRQLPRRQRHRRRRLPARVARVGAVHRAARPAVRRRLRAVLGLRRLPRRLHGRQVLHRPAARRPRPRVREGPRRSRPSPRCPTSSCPARPSTTRKPARPAPVPVAIGARRPDRACDEHPLAGFPSRPAKPTEGPR